MNAIRVISFEKSITSQHISVGMKILFVERNFPSTYTSTGEGSAVTDASHPTFQ